MTTLTRSTPAGTATAIAILRIVTGAIFLAHGYQKVFLFGHAGVTQAFTGMGIPTPGATSALIATVELLGGLALILGLGTRVAAFFLACDMLGAILLVHARNGFFLPTGIEFALMLFTASVSLAIAGSGRASVDASIDSRRAR